MTPAVSRNWPTLLCCRWFRRWWRSFSPSTKYRSADAAAVASIFRRHRRSSTRRTSGRKSCTCWRKRRRCRCRFRRSRCRWRRRRCRTGCSCRRNDVLPFLTGWPRKDLPRRPSINIIKLFSSSLTVKQNKLECLSPATFLRASLIVVGKASGRL